MLTQRVACWLEGVTGDTVVVSHGGVSRALRGLVLSLPDSQVPILETPQDRVLLIEGGRAHWL
jgi:probable phosphoglycerate mutase